MDKDKNPYNLLKEPVKVKLNVVYTTTTQTTYPGETNTDESVTVKATTVTNTTFSEKNNKDEGIVTITVKNNKGFDLPRTGGFGTLLFSGIGALLVVGGIGVLMGTKKKKDNA
ncbi:MAG: LPXTG cell wall anchor domain-containing protein [Subdoligranulum sp.]|nr:LPXTG cell wall anchor domain-containing protein [Subdoligranulum sp.]